ncbi:Hypothetical predicted protein [Mytilus galloprovincialis]|uniref:Uncharacterized protein n=1 Tax=Mytilus galloprovincialis TaxID=29158 RepID=A0A8B6C676_MYTGA|nr:Hypothetical predicted protein [Mytilus galloprovincialis]
MSTEDLARSREGSKEPEVICAVCLKFEPQAWRKKFCKNCFHSLDEHSTDGEKETGHEKLDIEKNLLKKAEDNETTDKKFDKILKDKLAKDDKNKSNKPSTDKPNSESDKTPQKHDLKTSSIADKFNKKITGSALSEKGKSETSTKATEKHDDKDQSSVTNKLKGKFEINKKPNDKTTDVKDGKVDTKTDKPEPKLDNDKAKLWGSKSKFEQKSSEKENKTDSEKKEIEKTKTWGAKSKFEPKSQDVKDEKIGGEKKDEKKVGDDEHKAGVKQFKPPEKQDTKMKWKNAWGSTLANKKQDDSKKDETTEDKLKIEGKENESGKDSIRSKFESKGTGNLFGVTKKTEPSIKDKIEEKTKAEEKKEDSTKKTESKDIKEDKGKSWANRNLKESDKLKETEKSKFGDKNIPKEIEKSKFGDLKDNTRSKLGDNKMTTSVKEPEKTKFGDKPAVNKEPEKSKFGDNRANLFEQKNTLKDKTEELKKAEKDIKKKEDAKEKTDDSKSKLDDKKTSLWGSKSKFETNKIDDKKTNKFNIELKKSDGKISKPPDDKSGGTETKSEIENKKNEKLEGKLKLDIKKAESVNTSGKDSGQSVSDWRKEKYEKLSKTPTTTTPGKILDKKAYSRSKSDTLVTDKDEKESSVTSTSVKMQPSSDKKEHNLSSKSSDVKQSEIPDTQRKIGRSPIIQPTQDQKEEFSGINDEVKDEGETTASKESLPKLNTDAINKIKDAAKFLLDDDFDDGRYNSLGRTTSGNKSTPSQQATPSLQSSAKSEADDKTGSHKKSSVQENSSVSKKQQGKHDVENVFNEKFNSEAEKLRKQLKQMEERCSELEEENKNLKNGLLENEKHSGRLMKQKQDVENQIKVLQKNLSSLESKCSKFETENTNLVERIKKVQSKSSTNEDLKSAHMEELNYLRERLGKGENIVDELRNDNENLKQEILDLKSEMEEMYDTFRDQEAEEFREIQKEMEMHAKNCRVLSFKLRKYERQNEQYEAEKENYEDKIQSLQNQISDGDMRSHIRDVEDELRLAKEVSVRLHDELDILEEKKCKVEDENHQLTQILEQSDKKQFKLEMEVDKLRDQVLIGRIGQQGSQEQDMSQLTRDLFDSMERETDLKDQLQFAEEEVKDLRRKKDELDEENENLSVQLKKMSASKITKYKDSKKLDDPDFTEAEIELKVHLELNEQELMVARRKIQDLENENENLLEQSKVLKDELSHKEHLLALPQPPLSPNTYYEERLKEMNFGADELRWKIIEKDREIEKLSAEVLQTRQSKLRKSRSLETDFYGERKKLLDLDLSENVDFRDKVISEARGTHSPEQLQHHKPYTTCNDSRDNKNQEINKSPDDGINSSFAIQTQFYSRSKLREPSNSLNQSFSNDNLEQLKTLQDSVDNLQEKITKLEAENVSLKEKFTPETEDTEGETREELMDKILDMEDDAENLASELKKKDTEIKSLQAEVTSLKKTVEIKESDFRRKELELLRDLDYAQEKSDVLSNLLDIVKDRADAAEAELERLAEESRSTSAASENSARTVSVLSDISFGSDEVFVEGASRESSAPGSPESASRRKVIHKDWEGQFRKRIHCLERILAEERQKLAASEKKLALVSTETLSTAMSDDAKLHEREKEILHSDLQETKKHLRIASDQIHGLKERIGSLEDENSKLKNSFWENQPTLEDDDRTLSGSIDTVLSVGTPSGSIDTVLSVGSSERLHEDVGDSEEYIDTNVENEASEKEDIEYFRKRVASLEARLEEANDIWKSKSTATEKEKLELEEELSKLTEMCDQLRVASNSFKMREDKALKLNKEYSNTIKEKQSMLDRKDDIIQEHVDIIKQREDDLQQLLDQISQRDNNIRELRESVRSRDDRLKEKDEILQSLNNGTDEKQEEINFLNSEMSDNISQIKEKDEKLKELTERIENYENNKKESNIQIENERLKLELEDMAYSIGKVHTDNNTLQTEMEKTKQALSEAMVLWNKDRSTLGQELTVAREKLSIYEASIDKKESQAAQMMRKETHKCLEQREKLQHELRILKVEHDANIRTLKNEKLKLQDELTQTIRQLTTEMSNNDKMASDLERLKNQEEVAFQIQHHEKVLRAEYMAMKVRFETRLDNLQKEHSRLLTILDQMQHEKVLNHEIIKGVQKQMSLMKDNYHKNLEKSKEQSETLGRHIKELEGARDLAMDLQKKVESLKRQLEDQEYERAELVDKITAQRSEWEIERSNKQSKINELEERLAMINNAQSRTKDMQSRMEVAWNRERAEQKRLLSEAHNLAMDLQQQLKGRDDERLHEKRALLEQLRVLRKQLDEEQINHREQQSKSGTRDEQLCDLERRLKEVKDKAEKEHESSLKDQADLVRRLGEMRRQHKRDQRMMEDVLSGLTRLRELASIVVASENNGEVSDNELEQRLETLETKGDVGAAASEETAIHTEDIRQRINDVVLNYIKEALKEIHFAAENIARPRDISDEQRKQMRSSSKNCENHERNIRSLSSSELDSLKEDFVTETLGTKELEFLKQKYGPITPDSPIKYQRSISGSDMKEDTEDILPGIQMGSMADRRHNIMSTVHKEQGLTTKFPDPPPSFLLPRCINSTLSSSQTVTRYSKETNKTTTVRPIPKSISIDTCLLKATKMSPQDSAQSSLSHSPVALETTTHCSFQQNLTPIPVTHIVPSRNALSASAETVTPKTARRQFFADNVSEPSVHRPWPGRSRSHDSVSKREREGIVGNIGIEKDETMSENSLNENVDVYVNLSSDIDDQVQLQEEDDLLSPVKESKSDKKKRKAATRSISLDSSSVKKTLAKAGVSVMSPAAPSALTPSDIFAAVKRKFKTNIKRSSSLSEKELHSVRSNGSHNSSSTSTISKTDSLQEMKNTFEPPLSGLPPKSILIPPPTPPISSMQRKVLPLMADEITKTKRAREDKKDKSKKRQRSKSAERARTGPSFLEQPIVRQDIIPQSRVLGFETSV